MTTPTTAIHDVASGGYRYLEAFFQYSGGVRALDGYHIERVRLRHPLPVAEGFARIEKHLSGLGLPLTKALAEANRASFSIKSAPNAGTLVEVAFPPTRVLAE